MLSSKGEIKIHEFLTYGNIPFEEEYIFDDLTAENGKHLRFDFCCFDDDGNIDCLIEYNGRQHYEPIDHFGGNKQFSIQQEHDRRKREYAKENNFTLIEISYKYDTYEKVAQYLDEVLVA